MNTTHLRIDAQLHYAEPQGPHSVWFDQVRGLGRDSDRAIVRAVAMLRCDFNDHLNGVLSEFGILVTNVVDSVEQTAIGHTNVSDGVLMFDTLDTALTVRNLTRGKASETWVPRPDTLEAVAAAISACRCSGGYGVPAPRMPG